MSSVEVLISTLRINISMLEMDLIWHYENTPIQIDRKFYLQKLKIFW